MTVSFRITEMEHIKNKKESQSLFNSKSDLLNTFFTIKSLTLLTRFANFPLECGPHICKGVQHGYSCLANRYWLILGSRIRTKGSF